MTWRQRWCGLRGRASRDAEVGVTGIPMETKPLSERLRALVLHHASAATLTCTFTPGGKLHGIGIPSVLYCLNCRQAAMWHDVAEAAALGEWRPQAKTATAPTPRRARRATP